MREWNAETYHRISDPLVRWGLDVLGRLRVGGGELILDVGCGSGRLTERLLHRVPRGRVIGIDRSANMLDAARRHLEPVAGNRLLLVQADATALPVSERADVVFSTATFHWVLDHDALFRSVFAALTPGGRLLAQCGARLNLERFVARAGRLTESEPFASHFAGWTRAWEFADAATTARRLAAAGFVAVDTSEHAAPVTFPTADAFREFTMTVVCRPYLAVLPDAPLRDRFMDQIVESYASDAVPFELDYWRLNLAARKPFSSR